MNIDSDVHPDAAMEVAAVRRRSWADERGEHRPRPSECHDRARQEGLVVVVEDARPSHVGVLPACSANAREGLRAYAFEAAACTGCATCLLPRQADARRTVIRAAVGTLLNRISIAS